MGHRLQLPEIVRCLLINEVQPVGIGTVGAGAPGQNRRLRGIVVGIIIHRNVRIQSLGGISPVLPVQIIAIILRVSRDEDLPGGAGQNQVAAGLLTVCHHIELRVAADSLLIDARMPGLGNIKIIVHTPHDHLLPVQHAMPIDTGQLLRQQMLLNAVMMVEARLGTPADVEGGKHMGFRPVHDLTELRPVLHLLEGNLLHRRTGYDQSVKVFLTNII